MNTYIYVLKDPDTQQVRYVGKSDCPRKRLNQHNCLMYKKGTYLSSWLISLKTRNLKPIMEIIDIVDINNWKESEAVWIEFYKKQGCNLVNLTVGGEGCDGYRHSEENKIKMSKIQKDVWKRGGKKYIPTFSGKKHTDESLKKMSLSQSGEKNHSYGKKVPEEIKIHLSKKLGTEVIVNGVKYPSLRQAAKSLNMIWQTFRYRYKNGLQLI